MASTLTAKITADISGITSDKISIEKTLTATNILSGGVTSRSIDDTTAGGETVLSSADYSAGTIVYLRNRHASETINIELSASTTQIPLAAGQWAMFPWQGAYSIKAWAAANSPILEIGVFSAT